MNGPSDANRWRRDKPQKIRSNTPLLARATAVVRNGRHILDQLHVQTGGLQRRDRTFSTRPRSLDPNLDVTHAKLGRLFRGLLSRTLASKRSALATPLETRCPGGRPAKRVAAGVSHRHGRVVEGAVNVHDPAADISPNTLLLIRLCHRKTYGTDSVMCSVAPQTTNRGREQTTP